MVPLRMHFAQHFFGDLLALEIGFQRGLVLFNRQFDHGCAVFLGLLTHIGRNIFNLELRTEASVKPADGLHLDQVDQANEIGLGADRSW